MYRSLLIMLWMVGLVIGAEEHSICTCPESCSEREELGRSTWYLLHAIAKYNAPTAAKSRAFASLIDALKILYPCDVCRVHMIETLEEEPMTLSAWSVCKFHNVVNARLGKPEYPCTKTLKDDQGGLLGGGQAAFF